jgi:MFS family permease
MMETAEPVEGKTEPGWWTPGFRGIGLASLLSDLGHEVPTALLPGFLSSVLGAPAAALGLIEGVADGISGLAKVAGGPIADDPGRRRSVAVGGYTATALLSGLIGAATATWQVAILRTGAWAARGLRTPARNALLADAVDPSAYGRAYGFERAMDNLGAVLGPIAALGLVAILYVRAAILVSVVPGLLAGVAIVYAVRHLRRAEARRTTRPRLVIRPLLRGRLGRGLAVIGAFEVGNVAATLLILRATELLAADGMGGAGQLAIGLYVLYNLAGTLASLPFGRLGDRLGFGPVLAVASSSSLSPTACSRSGRAIPSFLAWPSSPPASASAPWRRANTLSSRRQLRATFADRRSGRWPGSRAWAISRRAASSASSGHSSGRESLSATPELGCSSPFSRWGLLAWSASEAVESTRGERARSTEICRARRLRGGAPWPLHGLVAGSLSGPEPAVY